MTGLAGMAFLMEGSTLREGKYQTPVLERDPRRQKKALISVLFRCR